MRGELELLIFHIETSDTRSELIQVLLIFFIFKQYILKSISTRVIALWFSGSHWLLKSAARSLDSESFGTAFKHNNSHVIFILSY